MKVPFAYLCIDGSAEGIPFDRLYSVKVKKRVAGLVISPNLKMKAR